MLRQIWIFSLTTVLLVACGDDGNTETTADASTGTPVTTTDETTGATSTPTSTEPTSSTTEGTTAPETTDAESSTGPVGETAANGEACVANGDCASLACEKFRDLEMGTCVEAVSGGNTRVMGTVIDFTTLQPAASVDLRAMAALTALTDPINGTAVLTATADANGQIDVTTTEPLSAAIGLVGVVQGGDYFASATGLAAPEMGTSYGPMNGNRDMWAVPSAKLTEWSGYLMNDPEIMAMADVLPLGVQGGVIGFVRDGATGMGAAGKVVIGSGAQTAATIRYLAEDGMSFTSDMTSSNGIFVIINPALAEKFTVMGSEDVIGTGGSAKNAAFVLVMTI
jgi:hypothetical protein